MDSVFSCEHYATPRDHVVLFPFMSKGHTVPILHLARLLFHRHLAVTVFTTPANRSFASEFLTGTTVSIIDLPFPYDIDGIPQGIESTDKLPSLSMFYKFALATKQMQEDFERALETLPRPIIFMVSDSFLWWTVDSATKFDIPRLCYHGMSAYSYAIFTEVASYGLFFNEPELEPADELITLNPFPWMGITRDDFPPEIIKPDHKSLAFELHMNLSAAARSYGQIVDSFYELEPIFLDYLNDVVSTPKAWCFGPFCLMEPLTKSTRIDSHERNSTWVGWLDQKLEQGSSVLYVAFGSQAEISPEQLTEIATGLEESKVNFLWVIGGKNAGGLPDGLEERVGERGQVVRDWVDQKGILMHESVQGFLSHCGWNSVLESICAGVPILAWPMIAEQHLNARMVHEEIQVGLRVETVNGSVRGFVSSEGLKKMVKELMEGEKGCQVRKKVKELSTMAKSAVQQGGSSSLTIDSLIQEMRSRHHRN